VYPFIELLLAPLLWFAVAAVALFAISTVYVRALLVAARLPRLLRLAVSVLLWLTFAAVAVAPLIGWVLVAKARYPAVLEFPAVLWPLLCFALCFVAALRPINRRLPQLQAAGLFRE